MFSETSWLSRSKKRCWYFSRTSWHIYWGKRSYIMYKILWV